ncbi:MAG: homocysteine S-methyltransferase family protein [Clostridia bacterium]|nr:homocysteine S-methyltransferase family protein [Clostridia bacterium]
MNFREFLQQNKVFLDGGTGTLLQAAGLSAGQSPEEWNLTHPEVVQSVAKAYYEAGSNVVSANTFGANLLKFSKEELEQIIPAAVAIAKQAREESSGNQLKFVALDIGPSGKLLKPLGDLDFEDAVSLFAETVRIGVRCGVDLVLIETMNDSYETKAALLAVKENCDLPVLVSNAYGEDGRLLNGATPEAMVALLEGMGADAIGANCSLGPDQLKGVTERIVSAASVPVLFKPNAGLPAVKDEKTVFDVSPEEFAASVADAMAKGVRIAGGCCGTTPEYISLLVKKAQGSAPAPIVQKNFCCISSYTHAVTFAEEPILIGERINPTGKKRFQQALREHDLGYVLQEGLRQAEKGVHVLDVNVGLPDIDEVALLSETVCELQLVTSLPLQLDTANPSAMERALRRYNGKALINSVNGKIESMEAIFPLQKKYGGVVIALTLDESGIPSTADGRIAIAEKILQHAEQYGIGKKDLIFDPLAMTVSADKNAAAETLEAVRRLTAMGCRTSLGVSNVSFGLPARDGVNATFFALALERGLSAAIMNPHSPEMMKTYYAFRVLRGWDDNCADYIAFCETLPAAVPAPAMQSKADSAETPLESSALQTAIRKGLKGDASRLAAEALTRISPLDLIAEEIVPALDAVGRGFENNTIYLPQLLMAAEAAKSAFEVLKKSLPKDAAPTRGPVVIATVKGDVHDIGKNIVKLLLENYGFEVIDLGKDVPAAAVAEQVSARRAPLVSLSALMTTTVPAMEETIVLLRKTCPDCRIMVGGAVLTQEYADKIGADFYGKDALSAVRYAETVC